MPIIIRRQIDIEGIVQGVGFRPFVYQRAVANGLAGWVLNDSRGVTIEIEGERAKVEVFTLEVRDDYPPLATISRFSVSELRPVGEGSFVIRASQEAGESRAQISPDTFVCPDCLAELRDPADRRYRYPFINCTNCGPRYTIVTGIPYDRPLTTMADFPMCPECQAEYDDPTSRRFHAQPNACPVCGPQLSLVDAEGGAIPGEPVEKTIALLKAGKIVAVKGLGGYHLAVDACNAEAVAELRRRKARDEKPFALMCAVIEQVRSLARLGDKEERLLSGPERPIVLLEKQEPNPLAAGIAPHNRYLGIMLTYTPLHELLLEGFAALVMTSANLSDEPICYRDTEARERLKGIADAYLGHDRRIHIRADDSIARVIAGEALLIRRSRGYVPRSLPLERETPSVLGVGAELKNSFCLTRGDRAYLSQHIGDLKNLTVTEALGDGVAHFQKLLEVKPSLVAHDLHPDYTSTAFAEATGLPRVGIQHHHAHLVSCLAENRRQGPAIGVIFDGIGYGIDGTLWGGEFLVGDAAGFERFGHLRTMRMPGGDAATREPYRMALGCLWECGLEADDLAWLQRLPTGDLTLLRQMWQRGINSPVTSSCGRLFDAVAALCGLRLKVSYEGQAALELEMRITPGSTAPYNCPVSEGADGSLQLDWRPMLGAILQDLKQQRPVGEISRCFHDGLATGVADVCCRLRQRTGLAQVALSGGVFQNRYLTEMVSSLLAGDNFEVYRHSLVPPNDGGLSLGQAVIAAATLT